MLMKHLRDIKGGQLLKFWSHLLKTVVMNKLVAAHSKSILTRFVGNSDCWDKGNLEECLIDCIKAWVKGIDGGIPDVFFPELNLMKRIRSVQAKQNTKEFLKTLLCKIEDNTGRFFGYSWKKVSVS